MVATRQEVNEWIEEGRQKKARWIISVCDTFDYEDYPVFVNVDESLKEKIRYYMTANMQTINEIISLELDGTVKEDLEPSTFL